MVLNTISKHYQRLDIPIKSRASSRKNAEGTPSRPKTEESTNKDLAKDESRASMPAPIDDPHQILAPKFIQRFIYDYINEKMKTEKLSIQVAPEFDQMLKYGLKVPLELNSMRTMKDPNYTAFRELIR